MRQSIFILCLLLGFTTASAVGETKLFPTYLSLDLEQLALEDQLFITSEDETTEITVESIEVLELEEEIEIGFDTKQYLPEGFNALKGKNDINWDEIEIVEVEEDVEIPFDTKQYLPKDFNPYKGMRCSSTKVAFHF